jgi:hypothetical protein
VPSEWIDFYFVFDFGILRFENQKVDTVDIKSFPSCVFTMRVTHWPVIKNAEYLKEVGAF